MNIAMNIQPRFVVAATAAVTFLMVGTAVIELQQSREELSNLMQEEALSLAETIDRSGANNLLSMARIEELIADRLLNNAYYVARLDSLGMLRSFDLKAFAAANHLYRINVFDARGNKIMSSYSPSAEHKALPERYSPADILVPILQGKADQLVIGLKEARVEEGQRFAVAVRRTHHTGGAIVVNLDAADLLSFRRTIGIGKLLRDLGDNSGVIYVALQDTQGIIAASSGVTELSSVSGDVTLSHSISADTTLTRIITFNGADVFEVVRPFTSGATPVGVLRIGLSMDEVRNAEARMFRRMVIMSLVVIVIGALTMVFIMAQQNYQIMRKKFTSIKTLTGNILAQMRDGVVTVDLSGVVTLFNARAAEILGTDAKGMEGRALQDLDERIRGPMKDLFSGADGLSEFEITLPNGIPRVLGVTLSSTRNDNNVLEGRTAVLRDLTEARRRERETQQNERMTAMGELASGVAHEIRNPLNAIAMIAQRFRKEFTPRRGALEYRSLADVMQNEIRRVNTIIRHFLSFSRPARLQPARIDAGELTTYVASIFSVMAAEKGVHFQFHVHGQISAFLDREQMTQALLNVLQNALDATSRGGSITLETDHHGGRTRITVTDTGEGMSPETMEKIFNLYFTTKPEGTGLGLSITQQIISQHGGAIEVKSAVGRGTVLSIVIPDQASP